MNQRRERAGSRPPLEPNLNDLPDLAPIDWSSIGATAPKLVDTPVNDLTPADVVIITWTSAEWAAMNHVFTASDQSLDPYHYTDDWPGWQRYTRDMPDIEGWYEWGSYRLVEMNGEKVMLFKSNTHLDWPDDGKQLAPLVARIVKYVKPRLVLSIGTAGGARITDPLGTVNVVNAGTLYDSRESADAWPTYRSRWEPCWQAVERVEALTQPIPVNQKDLQSLANQFNAYYETLYSLDELNPDNLNLPEGKPALNNLAVSGIPLLTTSTFVVGTTDGKYNDFACIEMDDAVIFKTIVDSGEDILFGSARNLSDPVQNASLPAWVQSSWGSLIYKAYGLYTSFGGALTAWATVNGFLNPR